MTSRVAAVVLALLFAGCSCGEKLTDDQKKAGAEEVVRAFYGGLDARSCERISPLLLGERSAEECDALVSDLTERDVHLVDVLRTTIDGRDPNAVIVKVRVRDRGREREMLMRAELDEGTWKLRM